MTLSKYRFDRMELAGSLGDLGTLLPLAIGMIMLNGMHATNVIGAFGLFYISAGLYFGVPTPVQPMKVICAYAIAQSMTPPQIAASGLWMGALILLLGVTKAINIIRQYTPKAAIRGIQLSVGIVLLTKGLKLIAEKDPNLSIQTIGPMPTSILIGIIGMVVTLFFLKSKKLPSALLLVALGIFLGLGLGSPVKLDAFSWQFTFFKPLPYGVPTWSDFIWVIPIVVLPQLPMTIGNAIISNTDLTLEYYPHSANRVSNRSLAISQGLANFISFFLGGIPMCHGAGGVAAHYQFGARTAGANLIIGGIFLLLALVLGDNLLFVLRIMPQSILGVLLAFSGLQLAMMIQDINERKDLFVVLSMLGIALIFNQAIAFIAGIIISYALKSQKLNV